MVVLVENGHFFRFLGFYYCRLVHHCSVCKVSTVFDTFIFSFFEVQLILKLQYSIVFLRSEWEKMEYHHFLKSKFVVSVKNSAFFQVNEILIGNSETTKNFIFMKFSWLPPSPKSSKIIPYRLIIHFPFKFLVFQSNKLNLLKNYL